MHVYETTHRVAHSAEEMFALVARVEDYPKFLPLCEELDVKRREQHDGKEVLVATMTVGYGMIRESFTTKVHLDPRRPHHPGRISRRAVHLPGEPLALPARRTRRLARSISISPMRFRSRLFERLVGRLFAKAVERYTSAFETRADAVYGRNEPVARLTAMSATDASARSTLSRLISARPRSPKLHALVVHAVGRAARRRDRRARPASRPCRRRDRRCR